MTKELAEWPSKRGAITKIMPSDGCKGDTAPWRWDCGMISTNLDCIWEMSVKTLALEDLKFRGDTRRGRIIYKNACVACHGKNGEGNGLLAQLIQIEMVDFTRSERMRILSDRKLIKTITEGKGDFMPSWKGTLNDDEIIDVATYVRLIGR